ncbi:NUDIX domain-containing protein [Pseudooceanicola algae]|uniref:GDP-mannose pyrophosphatase n=1 Tax=Pseudooceanicola algae TaxID=1537215 RepID=A0A418SJK3_9RHOB|nr:NUDIX hydrolase [Pseudooceanicola algae]QPM91926.1 ADP-ribose pyrophosphatase [Pseudooceanicola algae]
MRGKITRQATRIAYKNNWMTVHEDDVTFPNGHQSIFGVVEKPDFVAVIPVDAEGRIHLVSQYRYAVSTRTWEIPQGAWPNRPDAPPEEVARGELREETGFRAASMELLGRMYQAPGLSTQSCHLYLATGLTAGETEREVTESDMECAGFTLAQLRGMIAAGEIMDGTSMAAFGMLALQGRLDSLG